MIKHYFFNLPPKMKKQIEIWLLKIAICILKERNVNRAKYISRWDNNHLYFMAEKIESVVERLQDDYENWELTHHEQHSKYKFYKKTK